MPTPDSLEELHTGVPINADPVAQFKILRENTSRYPYTYAYDLLRQCGLADSRADAVSVAKDIAQKMNMSHKDYCMMLAERYVAFTAYFLISEHIQRAVITETKGEAE